MKTERGERSAEGFRKRAAWYRKFAEAGDAAQRDRRLTLAERLERRAEELERQAGADGQGPPLKT